MSDSFCPTATSDTSGLKATGTATYNADLTYTAMVSTSGPVKVTFPAACLTQNGTTLTCAQLDAGLQATLADTDFQSASCVAAGTGCTCQFVTKPKNNTETGTHTTAGTIIIGMPAGGTPDMTEYRSGPPPESECRDTTPGRT